MVTGGYRGEERRKRVCHLLTGSPLDGQIKRVTGSHCFQSAHLTSKGKLCKLRGPEQGERGRKKERKRQRERKIERIHFKAVALLNVIIPKQLL